jgi:hypothetical protein
LAQNKYKEMFRWLIFQYAQKKGDGKYFYKHMLPKIMNSKYVNVEIDLFFCKPRKGNYTHYQCNSKEIVETAIKKQPFLTMVRKYAKKKKYDGFMFGGHSNGILVGRLGSRLASAKQLAKALSLSGRKLKCVAFDSCLMGNSEIVEAFESCSKTLLAMSSLMPSHSFMENKRFFKYDNKDYKKYLRVIADSYMGHRTVKRLKYPCSSLFFIPQSKKLYTYLDKLEDSEKIDRKPRSVDNFCEIVKVSEPKIQKKLKQMIPRAQTGMCVISVEKKKKSLNK